MIEVPEAYVGAVMEKLGSRKAEMRQYGHPRYRRHRISNSAFPRAASWGTGQMFLTDTNGNGIMNQCVRRL